MAFAGKDLPEVVETDNASLHYVKEEETFESEKYLAIYDNDYKVCFPPEGTYIQSTQRIDNKQHQGIDYFQCSQNHKNYGSGSDSAEEESSPYSSQENLKYQAIAPTGKPRTKVSVRHRPQDGNTTIVNNLDQHRSLAMANVNAKQQGSGPYAIEETRNVEQLGSLALSGSSENRTTTIYKKSCRRQVPHREPLTPFNETDNIKKQKDGSGNQATKQYEDVSVRLKSYLYNQIEWPHVKPSAEIMAKAGFVFIGVFTVQGKTVYDMVECYKCRGRLYGFTETDDPAEEHRKYYPSCL